MRHALTNFGVAFACVGMLATAGSGAFSRLRRMAAAAAGQTFWFASQVTM